MNQTVVTLLLDWWIMELIKLLQTMNILNETVENPDNDRSICALFWKSSKLSKPWEMMTQRNSHSLKSCRVLLTLGWTLDQKYWPYVGSKLGWGSLFLLGKIYYVRSRIWPNHSWKELFVVKNDRPGDDGTLWSV